MFSFAGHPIGNRLSDFVRFEQTTNLFYDENLEEPVVVQVDGWKCTLRFKQGTFTGEVRLSPSSAVGFQGGYDDLQHTTPPAAELAAFKFYRFTVQSEFARRESEYLLPPKGENLMSLIQGHREFRKGANQFFAPLGLRLNLRPQENKMEVI